MTDSMSGTSTAPTAISRIVVSSNLAAATIEVEWACGCLLRWPVAVLADCTCVPQTPSAGEEMPVAVAEACRVFNLDRVSARSEAGAAVPSGPPVSMAPHGLLDGQHFIMTPSTFEAVLLRCHDQGEEDEPSFSETIDWFDTATHPLPPEDEREDRFLVVIDCNASATYIDIVSLDDTGLYWSAYGYSVVRWARLPQGTRDGSI